MRHLWICGYPILDPSVEDSQRKPPDRPTFVQRVKRVLRFDWAHGRVPKPASRLFGKDRPEGR